MTSEKKPTNTLITEKLGEFYLGRKHNLSTGETSKTDVLYDSKDLTTHAVCVGMTGSGKTGLCLSLLEEAGLDGVPAIAIDPKGDLGNLLLTFPDFKPSDYEPWVDASDAQRKDITREQLAENTAELWKNGLAKWAQDGERIRRYNSAVEKVIYTPGSSAGVPLTILKSFNAPPQAVLDDGDAFRDRVQSAASGILALLGIDADPVKSREHILLSNVLSHAWQEGRDLDLPALIQEIQQPPFKRVGVVDLESFFPADDRLDLGMQLNNLLASPSFASWLEGEPLDIQKLLYTDEGRPKLSILSIAHLNDSERMFFVTILLNEMLSWMRSQPGTGSLRALLYMDEVYGYFPPTANPPSKKPMLTLLKQARAFGVGCVLATQNPVDLDYKGLSNAGTWLLGRLQTERDKSRVMEGLEGASAQAGAKFDRGKMEATLAALGSRVFLMNNVHDNAAVVFHTRWAMSYLSGPLTRNQISKLMADTKAKLAKLAAAAAPSEEEQRQAIKAAERAKSSRPVITADIQQQFYEIAERRPQGGALIYRPGLLGLGQMHFVKSSVDVDQWRDYATLQTVHDELPRPPWDGSMVFYQRPRLEDEPQADAAFDDLPSEMSQEKNYKGWERDLKDHLYQSERYTIFECEPLDVRSESDESEADFRIRITQQARDQREEEKEKVREKFSSKLKRQQARVDKARSYLEEQRSQSWAKMFQFVIVLIEWIASLFGGSKSRRSISSSGSQASRERSQANRAEAKLMDAEDELEELEHDQQVALEDLDIEYQPNRLPLEKIEIGPRKSDIAVDRLTLVWLPFWKHVDGRVTAAY
ncbi:ATP-binding protein [Adhaeretor mobilis]|uniref:AAA-like domain protein n=1 Tax=Adhaeretor mobilis TaxID=1930276 RepID=A0A517N0P6_9BACT|nr:ATP-binding protein [Adhaeretor mobilis]QDT00703.1 AAA-like domain protein [Adhaeretor mobilis]